MTDTAREAAVERVRAHVMAALHGIGPVFMPPPSPFPIGLGMNGVEEAADKIMALIAALTDPRQQSEAPVTADEGWRLAEYDRLMDFYFSPWGAGKAAEWEDLDGDGPAFDANAMLLCMQRRARFPAPPTGPEQKDQS